MPEDALVHHVGEERRLRHKLMQQMRDVFLSIRHESFIVARAASERHNHSFTIFRGRHRPREMPGPEKRRCRSSPGNGTKEIPAAERNRLRYFERIAAL